MDSDIIGLNLEDFNFIFPAVVKPLDFESCKTRSFEWILKVLNDLL